MGRVTQAEAARVRRALLDTAARHFAAHGFGGASINRISVDAGFAKGTVYNYFSSKATLFQAVLAVGSTHTVEAYRARRVDGPTRDHLLALAEADIALVRQHPAFMQTFLRELIAPDPPIRALLLTGLAPLTAETSAILARGQHAGEVRTDRGAETLAAVFLGDLSMAYVRVWLADEARWESVADDVVSAFLDGTTPR